jgi:WD40 repeat protein
MKTHPIAMAAAGVVALLLGTACYGQQPRAILRGKTKAIHCLAFTPNGKFLACAGKGRVVQLWDVVTSRPTVTFTGHKDFVAAVAFSPDGRTLASGSFDQTVKLWDVATGAVLHTLNGHEFPVYAVAYGPQSRILASASIGPGQGIGEVKIWHAAAGKERAGLVVFDPVTSLSFSPDGKTLAAGSYGKAIRFFDPTLGKELATLFGHEGMVSSVQFGPAGKVLVSAGAIWGKEKWRPCGGEARLWDLQGGKDRVFGGHAQAVMSVAFTPDGQLLACGSLDGAVTVWDVAMGKVKAALEGHAAVTSVAFDGSGQLLAAGGLDGTVRLWDVPALLKARH